MSSAKHEITFSICVTTTDRNNYLEACLTSIQNQTVSPVEVVVSDDSKNPEKQAENLTIAKKYNFSYVKGPRIGASANRNCGYTALTKNSSHIFFSDDDISLKETFLEEIQNIYSARHGGAETQRWIVSGYTRNASVEDLKPKKLRLSKWYGRFEESDRMEAASAQSTVFPRSFMDKEKFDEKIFFGYEDAELYLRALKGGIQIDFEPSIGNIHLGVVSSIGGDNDSKLKRQALVRAANAYVMLKRYLVIEKKPLHASIFAILFWIRHLKFSCTVLASALDDLFKKGSLKSGLKKIKLIFLVIRDAHVPYLLKRYFKSE